LILGGVGLGVGMLLGIVLLLSMSSSSFLPSSSLLSFHRPFFSFLSRLCSGSLDQRFTLQWPNVSFTYPYPYRSGKLKIRLPPVLCDPLVARAHYDKVEKEVEEGVRQSQIREKATGTSKPAQAAGTK
jgi:hypothetical protein